MPTTAATSAATAPLSSLIRRLRDSRSRQPLLQLRQRLAMRFALVVEQRDAEIEVALGERELGVVDARRIEQRRRAGDCRSTGRAIPPSP